MMNRFNQYFLGVVTLCCLPIGAQAAETPKSKIAVLNYRLEVSLDPAQHKLQATCKVKIANRGDPLRSLRFGLHGGFSISKVAGQQGGLKLEKDPKLELPYSPTAAGYRVDLGQELGSGAEVDLTFQYAGDMTGEIQMVNALGADRVELDLYSAWYPLFDFRDVFDFELSAELPSEMKAFSSGPLIQSEPKEQRTRYLWQGKSALSVFLFAAPNMKLKEKLFGKTRLQIVYRSAADAFTDGMLNYFEKAFGMFSEYYGPLKQQENVFTVIYSPRRGWGYSRAPVVIGSEQRSVHKIDPSSGRTVEEVRGMIHEIGHFWWTKADPTTSDDWLNESLAELSSLVFVEKAFGPQFVKEILQDSAISISRTLETPPITKTLRSDSTAYDLFYSKGSYIMRMLQNELGNDQFLGLLKECYAVEGKLTTPIFKELLAKHSPADRADQMLKFLNQWIESNDLVQLKIKWDQLPAGELWKISGEVSQVNILTTTPAWMGTLTIRAVGDGDRQQDHRVTLSGGMQTPFQLTNPFKARKVELDPDREFLTYDSFWDHAGDVIADFRKNSIDWPDGTAFLPGSWRVSLLAPSTILRLGEGRDRFGAGTSLLLDGLGMPNLDLKVMPYDVGLLAVGLEATYLYSVVSEPKTQHIQGSVIVSTLLNFVRPFWSYLNLNLGVFVEGYGVDLDKSGLGMWLSMQLMLDKKFLLNALWRRDFTQGNNGWDVRLVCSIKQFLLSAGFLAGNANPVTRFSFLRDDIDWAVVPFVDLGYLW